ncbi:MAG: TIGR01777 family oxidoreductase [Chitinophagaceae bacterium]|uniref:TIGR01777 family oxidoreductase n=1 Tax=Sphingobacterium sp. N143 TaxID=2746727 RepID=UPI002575558A|nr:TIGR01777 family oxidoreductase [Sphingobacterium sp. N143]MBX2924190.1 TIGR01777 family oxidoreductase [Chitinophagaceae bacterium]MBX3257108.1 TIGR01777 family oxidoreductase [Chitinophagaceae bacterium]MDM1296115.1 TIGR01777 family protein [Sphingobacterium sp. N143]
MKKILIAGGTGFVGKALIKHLVNCGYMVNVLTRRNKISSMENIRYFEWDIKKGFIDEKAFEGVSKIINLTGANITEKRWTEKRKVEIIESRTKAIDLLFTYVKTRNFSIDIFISSSAIGYYGAITTDEIFTEKSNNGSEFLASVCRKWEKTALQFDSLGVATVILRKGVVLGRDGGMYQKLAPLAKLGINTSLGNGRQYLPWIDIRDLVRLYEFILKTDELSGVFNAVSSEHIMMNDFSKALLRSFGKTSFLPNVPAFLVRLFLGEMSVMLLKGSRVSNYKIKQTGFKFEYSSIEKTFFM